MSRAPIDPTRRRLCAAAANALASSCGAALVRPTKAQTVQADHGRVDPPLPTPAIAVHCADGRATDLTALLRDRATALQLMFSDCSSVCPIQGAIFQRVQLLLPDQSARGIQLLSLGIDPHGDPPAALRGWLRKFDAREGWVAAAPSRSELQTALDFFGDGRDAVDDHSTQVNIIDRRGALVFRTPPLPSADAVADILRRM